MFEAKGIEFEAILEVEKFELKNSSADGIGFAISGGVANAVVNQINPELKVKVDKAEGLHNCKKMLMMAKAGKYDGYLLEGMACSGGCVAGAGTIQPIKKTVDSVKKIMANATIKNCDETGYKEYLNIVEERKKEE